MSVAKLSVLCIFIIMRVQLRIDQCLLYGIAGYPLFRGFYSIEVYGEMVGTFRNIVILWVSTVEGCLLSRVPLYLLRNHIHQTFALLLSSRKDHSRRALYFSEVNSRRNIPLTTGWSSMLKVIKHPLDIWPPGTPGEMLEQASSNELWLWY